jgi:PAS domain S-box-containing protein
MDSLRLKNLVDELIRTHDDLVYVFIIDKYGAVPIHSFDNGFPGDLLTLPSRTTRPSILLLDTGHGLIYDCSSPVTLNGDRLGLARIGLSRRHLEVTVRGLLLTSAGTTLGGILLALILASWFAGTFTKRLNSLKRSADEVIKGNLEVRSGPEMKSPCWEIMQCNNELCPAYHDHRRRCWYIVGTLCPICDSRGFPEKIESCLKCPVYQKNVGDELQNLAESFDVMTHALQERINALKETENRLSQKQHVLRTILDGTPDIVSLQDSNLVYQAVNTAFCQFFQLEEKDVLGKTDSEIFSEEQARDNDQEDREILATGNPLSKEIHVSKDSSQQWFHILKIPVTAHGVRTGLLLTARDITILKKYQERLVQSQKMEDLGRLAGGVAHEINTPLGIILGYTQMLLDDVPPQSQIAEDLKMIEKQTKICSSIVSDLLGFSRQSGALKEELDLNTAIQEVVSLVAHTFSLNHVRITTDLEQDLPMIQGDREKLKQVWINLLNNAFDAVQRDGLILVTTSVCLHGKGVICSVTDTGSGISEDVLQKIFDPFFSTKPVGQGTGLGLSVTFGIVNEHGGRIHVASPVPKDFRPVTMEMQAPGTTFLIELPLEEGPLPDAECLPRQSSGFETFVRPQEGMYV